MRLRVPSSFWSPMPLRWEDRPKYVEYHQQPWKIVHVLRVPYHFSFVLAHAIFLFHGENCSPSADFIPNLNLRVILQPMRNLWLFSQHFPTKTLRSVAQQATYARDAQRECTSQPAVAAERGLSRFISVMKSLD